MQGRPAQGFRPSPRWNDCRQRRMNDISILQEMAQLNADYMAVRVINSFKVGVQFKGIPGIRRINEQKEPEIACEHTVHIQMLAEYPTIKPVAYYVEDSPIFHPNVSLKDQSLCWAGKWTSVRCDLCFVCCQIAHLLQGRCNLNPNDILNPEAAVWYYAVAERSPSGKVQLGKVRLKDVLWMNRLKQFIR